MKAVARAGLAMGAVAVVALSGCQADSFAGGQSPTTSSPPATCSTDPGPTFKGTRTAFEAPASVEARQAVSAQISTPTLTKYPSGKEGYQVAKVHLGAQVRTNGVFAISPKSIVLADAKGNACARPATDPLPGAFPVLRVDEKHPDAGDVGFLVPKGADLSKYSVFFLDKPGASRASAQWSKDGKTPRLPVENTCSGGKSTYSTKNAQHNTFEDSQTFGDDTVSLKITVHAPKKRTLKPSKNQPNDVDGIAVHVTGTAKGALGFIGRKQFRLVDGSGHLCEFNPLGSTGETLSSALIKPDRTRKFTLIFWMPRGADIKDWTMLYFSDPKSKKVTAYWTMPKKK